jgi:hypothetical protein
MWNRIELNPKKGLFLMKNGLYIYPGKNITSEVKDKIIGYCLDDSRVMSINSSKNLIPWSLRNDKIPELTNYQFEDRSIEPYSDLEGEYNTSCIIKFCKENNINLQNDYPSIYYCKSFSPGYKDGEWYLPSVGELRLFYEYRWNFRKLCRFIGLETNMNSDSSGSYRFWSSTPYSDFSAWFLFSNTSSPSYYHNKRNILYVVPFLKPSIDLKNLKCVIK